MTFEVRCPLHGSIPFNERERRIIDHPFLQRLRYITQLGFAQLVYPGATHSRFSHVLGVMHLAGRIWEHVTSDPTADWVRAFPAAELAYFRQVLRFAALFHDVGHAPFSHSFEPLLPPRSSLPLPRDWYADGIGEGRSTHEDYSVAAAHALSQEHPDLLSPPEAQDACALIDHRVRPTSRLGKGPGGETGAVYPLLQQIISGEIDADRMDYLQRDAHFAGVAYGFFDQGRLIGSLAATATPDGVFMTLDGSGVYTYENFLMARFHMAMQVYFHKTLLPFDYFLHQAVQEGEIAFALDGSLENFLSAREDVIGAQLYAARRSRWSARIVERRPLTRLLQVHELSPERRSLALEALQRAGVATVCLREERRLSNLGCAGEPGRFPLLVRENELGRTRLRPLQEVSLLLAQYNRTFVIENVYCDNADFAVGAEVLRGVLD